MTSSAGVGYEEVQCNRMSSPPPASRKERTAASISDSVAMPVDKTVATYLRDQLLVVSPTQFPAVRDALLPQRGVNP